MALYQRRPQVEPQLFPPNKRRKHHHSPLNDPIERAFNNETFHPDDLGSPADDILATHELYPINDLVGTDPSPTVTTPPPAWMSPAAIDAITQPFERNSADAVLYSTDSNHVTDQRLAMPLGTESPTPSRAHQWVTEYGYLEPILPNREQRIVLVNLRNPFQDNASNRIPHLRPAFTPRNGEVNGYIKFRLRRSDIQPEDEAPSPKSGPYKSMFDVPKGSVSRLHMPRDFGLGCKLDNVDRKLFQFYRVAWCSGRTILPQTNSWLVDLGPMLAGNDCLRHALLSLACTYVLDYLPDEPLRKRANYHYGQAVALLDSALNDPSEQDVGKGDALVGAITLFTMHDVVTWEVRRNRHLVPRWLEGARLASKVLDSTDPGYRYYKPNNVQATRARISNTIIVGRAAILVLAVLPLDVAHTSDNRFGWLLHGTRVESLKIHGGCGFSPKLLHCFAQITHLAAAMKLDPDSPITPIFAENLEKRIAGLRQWSEVSAGCHSLQQLFDTCVLNEDGVIDCPIKMTELTGEAWRLAAHIYLRCRLFRLPRSHSKVIELAGQLAEILRRMPCAGPLFTAQAPFMPVFLLGVVSTEPEHRHVASKWFETVINASTCRSSVPPAWEALQRLQTWMDNNIAPYDDQHVDRKLYGRRYPWWEYVVNQVLETEGTLCLI